MISPKEIKIKAEKWWNDGSFLISFLNNQEFFEREIPKIGLVDVSKVHENYKTIIAEQDLLKSQSKEIKGYGYVLEWEGKNFQRLGSNQFIKKVIFQTQDDFLKYIGKEKAFNKFKENVILLEQTLPQIKEWIKANPLKVVEYENEWMDLLNVCKYFIEDHIPGKYYIRELPINIHTKFIEGHKQILFSLLDFCIPGKINVNAKNDFCLRYNLKDKENLARIRILGDDLKQIFPFSDFAIPLSELRNADINASTVFITENLMNFLTLPKRSNSIALWSGGGFNVSYLANINWLKEKEIFYWGDIDAAGLQILSQIRTYYDHVQSIMMDRDTFTKFYENGKGKPTSAVELKGLNAEEKEFFKYLKDNDLRLEQEKIPQEYVIQQINLLKTLE
ncbi:MAG: hypothetical protein H0W75_00175 [Chitinophagaceae bacterium]|nr:hypothetical protein [Chitinophagaceae bacterium]